MNFRTIILIPLAMISIAFPAFSADMQPMQVETKKTAATLGELARKKKESLELFKQFVTKRNCDPDVQQLCELTARLKNLPKRIAAIALSFDKNPGFLVNPPGGIHQDTQFPDLRKVPSSLYAKNGKVYMVYPHENTIKLVNPATNESLCKIPYRTHGQSSTNNNSSSSNNGQADTSTDLTCVSAFDSDGSTYVMAVSKDNYVRLWNADKNVQEPCVCELIRSPTEPYEPLKIIEAHAYQKNGKTFLIMSSDEERSLGAIAQVHPWKLLHVDSEETFYMFGDFASPCCVFLHNDKKYTVTIGNDSEVELYDISKNSPDRKKGRVKLVNEFQAFQNQVLEDDHWYCATAFCTYEKNGTVYLIIGFKNGGIAIFDPFAKPVKRQSIYEYFSVVQGKLIGKLIGHNAQVHSIIPFKRNGKDAFATAAKDGSVYIWEFGPGTFEKIKNDAEEGLLNVSDEETFDEPATETYQPSGLLEPANSSDIEQDDQEAEERPAKRQKTDSNSDDDADNFSNDTLGNSLRFLEESTQTLDNLFGSDKPNGQQPMTER